MKTETLRISEKDIERFKNACKEISYFEFISYDLKNKEAKIEYKYPHSFFYLGQMFQLKNNN